MRAPAPSEEPAAHLDDRGQGPPLLLLHGWGANAALMLPVARLLAGTYRTLSPDLPGHGSTAPPPVPWGATEYAEWVVALLDRLGLDRVDVIGHSNGGRIGIRLALLHPERVRRLLLTGSAGIRPQRGLRYHLRVRAFKLLRVSTRLPGPLGARARGAAARRGSRDWQESSGVMRGTFVRLVNEDLRPLLSQLRLPVLLVWGDHDAEVPLSDARTMEAAIADSGLVVLEGGTHFAYLEQAPRFARIAQSFFGDVQAGEGDVPTGGATEPAPPPVPAHRPAP